VDPHALQLSRGAETDEDPMTIALIVYIAGGIVFGGLAATFEIWDRPADLDRADGSGTFKSPRFDALWIGLFVAVCWPLLLIAVVL
jgi:hypothetical protein